MKNFLYLILSIAAVNCGNESENLKREMAILKAENDSLKTELDTLKTKFVFDKAFVKHIVNENKPMKAGEQYEGAFYFVAYNNSDRLLFTQDLGAKPDTLSQMKGGGYTYEFTARKGENNFHFKPLLKGTSEDFRNIFFDVAISDKRVVD